MSRLTIEVELAGLPHRFVTHAQLRQIEWTSRKVRYHVARGDLIPVLDNVYCLDGNYDPFLARAIAVCLRYPDAFMSGGAAGAYWGLRKGMPDHHEFTVPSTCRPRGVDFAQFRFARNIDERDVFLGQDGLRVSSPDRTVFEAAGRLDQFGLRSMVQSGLQRNLVSVESLQATGARLAGPGRRGTRLFRSVIDAALDVPPVHSTQELKLLEALRVEGLDVIAQYPLRLAGGGTIHLDAGVVALRLGFEVDGPTHDDPFAVHRDRSRDLQAAAVGWQVVRIPTAEIDHRFPVVMAMVRAIVRERRALVARPA